MDLIKSIRNWFGSASETRALTHTDYPFLLGNPVHSGEYVSSDTALAASAVYGCVRIISNTIASMPVLPYRRFGAEGRERATDHYLFDLLKNKVNPYTTAFLWKQHMCTSLLLHGNSYSQIIFNGRGMATAIYPLNPSRMTVTKTGDGLTYTYQTDNGSTVLPSDTVLHIRYLTTNGWLGVSPLTAARQAIGISLASERHTANFYSNGANFGTVIRIPAQLTAEKAKEAKEAILAEHQGSMNSHRPLFLFGNAELETLTLNHSDLQFLELRKFTVEEISRIYGVPLHLLNAHENQTYGSVEAIGLAWLRDGISSLLTNIESELNCTLLSDRERQTVFCEFLIDSLTKSDIRTRYEAYSTAIGKGNAWATVNEIRRRENLPPVDGGDVLLQPRQNTPEKQSESESE